MTTPPAIATADSAGAAAAERRARRDRLLSVARGDTPADLVLRNGRIVNVFSGRIEEADIAIAGDRIAGIGPNYEAANSLDLAGRFVAPGLIDAHVHIESSLCLPAQFASAVVPRGVTCAVIDPHEIANVAGVAGIRFMIQASRSLPLRVVVMAPSCVPATTMATSGATLDADALASLQEAHGLAEVMNFPGVIANVGEVREKLDGFGGRPIDGHAPGIAGKALNAYVAAGIGSDHECTTIDEAREKLSRGLYVLIREATNARNLETLLPLINSENNRRICFCTDDRTAADLLDVGGIDYMLRRAIEFGVDPVRAFRLCTLNTAEWFALHDRGAIAPGRFADLFVFDDLSAPRATSVFHGGRIVESDQFRTPQSEIPSAVASRTDFDPSKTDLRLPARSARVRVVVSQPDQLVTQSVVCDARIEAGFAVADVSRDLLKFAVVERHRGTGNVGLGFIRGFGLRAGAIAGTVAHDHHNLVVIGADDESMHAAIRVIHRSGGGLVATIGEDVLAELPLPVAGLMSDLPIAEVRAAYDRLLDVCKTRLGSPLHDPFMAMSFMALEVIPDLKLTDRGLIDVCGFRFTDLFV